MKRKLILFLTVLATTIAIFAFTVNADNVYSDFTQPGVNGEEPIFSFLGYSTSEDGSVCAGYKIDKDALDNYKSSGAEIKYGLVVSIKGSFEGNKPLDENGCIPEENKNSVLVINFENDYNRVFASLKNIPSDAVDSQLIMSLFVVDSTQGVLYIGDESAEEGPQSISFSDAVEGLPATPAYATEATVGGMTYSTTGETEPAWDRIRQQNNSNADYNTGSSLSSSQLTGFSGVKSKAQLIAAGGSLINMPAASALMTHYLKNTGATYNIDVAGFLTDDSGALNSRNSSINNALRAAEQLARKNKAITINQLTEGHPYQNELATQNWQYAIGSYFTDVDVINLTVTEVNGVKTYSADIKYIVTDFYNWDTNDNNKFKNIVSPHDLHELHKAGIAREFLSYGEITYSSITWTEGQTVDQITGLN